MPADRHLAAHTTRRADSDWRDGAACTASDPELFFPIGTTGPALAQTATAQHVCRGCPFRSACLEWAIQTGADFGIWGGLAEDERRALQRRRRRTSRTTTASAQRAADKDGSLRALDAAINHVRAHPQSSTSDHPDRDLDSTGSRSSEQGRSHH